MVSGIDFALSFHYISIMSYSTHQDLKEIYAEIDQYLASISVPVFSGVALNDLAISGSYAGSIDKSFVVKIDATGTPDTFTWSDNGGTTWNASGVQITGDVQLLSEGISVIFGATTGHTAGITPDSWTFSCTAASSDDERAFAYDWLNDHLRSMYSVPISSPPKTVVLAEAYYAAYVILLANNNAYASSFLAQAESLVGSLSFSELEDESSKGSSVSSSSNIQRQFSHGSYDSNGSLLGRGCSGDGQRGSLDDW